MRDRLGIGKVNYKSELEIICGKKEHVEYLPLGRIKAFIQIIRLYNKSFHLTKKSSKYWPGIPIVVNTSSA